MITDLFAASSRELFALTQECNQVLHWTDGEGWREEATPVKDSVWESGHTRSCVSLFGIWGRGPNDVYVVGDYAAILHYDGVRWTLESNPLIEVARLPAPARYQSALWSVGGDDEDTYAAGTYVLRRRGGKWSQLDRPMTPAPAGSLHAVVASRGAVYFAGSAFVGDRDAPRLLRLSGNRWEVLNDRIASFRYGIIDGVALTDGSAFLWSLAGELAHVGNDGVRLFHLRGFQRFVGAARAGRHVVVAGIREGRGQIAIIQPDSQEGGRQ